MTPKKRVKDCLYENESYKIRSACFAVYNAFGGAFKEKIIDRALSKALADEGLRVEEQKRIDIYFSKQINSYRAKSQTIVNERRYRSILEVLERVTV